MYIYHLVTRHNIILSHRFKHDVLRRFRLSCPSFSRLSLYWKEPLFLSNLCHTITLSLYSRSAGGRGTIDNFGPLTWSGMPPIGRYIKNGYYRRAWRQATRWFLPHLSSIIGFQTVSVCMYVCMYVCIYKTLTIAWMFWIWVIDNCSQS